MVNFVVFDDGMDFYVRRSMSRFMSKLVSESKSLYYFW